MRRLVVTLTLVFAFAAVAFVPAGGSAASAVQTRSCAQLDMWFSIQILGDKEWGWRLTDSNTLPRKTTVVAVWSLGGPARTKGLAVYGWISKGGARIADACRRTPKPRAKPGSLRAPVRVKDGWFLGRKYTCLQEGRFVIETRDLATGARRMTVRMQRTGELLAIAEVKRGGGWLRASQSCSESEK